MPGWEQIGSFQKGRATGPSVPVHSEGPLWPTPGVQEAEMGCVAGSAPSKAHGQSPEAPAVFAFSHPVVSATASFCKLASKAGARWCTEQAVESMSEQSVAWEQPTSGPACILLPLELWVKVHEAASGHHLKFSPSKPPFLSTPSSYRNTTVVSCV